MAPVALALQGSRVALALQANSEALMQPGGGFEALVLRGGSSVLPKKKTAITMNAEISGFRVSMVQGLRYVEFTEVLGNGEPL